jgi:hypothetical protein
MSSSDAETGAKVTLVSRDGGESCAVPCLRVSCLRQLGRATTWIFDIKASLDQEIASSVARVVRKTPCFATLRSDSDEQIDISPEVLITAANWVDREGTALRVEGTSTIFPRSASVPHALEPRFRVHRVADLAQMFRRFDRFLELPNHVLAALQKYRFPDESKSSVIQNGISDWTFLQQMLAQCALSQRRFLLSSNAPIAKDTDRPWRLVWGSLEENRKAGLVGSQAKWSKADGDLYTNFDRVGQHELGGACPAAEFPTVGVYAPHRTFQPDVWNHWHQERLPTVISGSEGFVWKIKDEVLYDRVATPVWSTWLSEIPANADIDFGTSAHIPRPFMCTGVVTNSAPSEPWVEVRLNNFQKPDDLIWARLTTASSGADQKSGLHLSPAVGSTVAVVSSSWFSDSVWVLGNIRREPTTHPAPSLSSDGIISLICDQLKSESEHLSFSGKDIILKSSGVKLTLDSTKASVSRP